MSNPKVVLWVFAVALLLVAPMGLYLGVAPWRVAVVTIFELIMVFWLARWVKGERQ
jgi:uncharacterized membrane protein YphA (DoxX/SURF4 family)